MSSVKQELKELFEKRNARVRLDKANGAKNLWLMRKYSISYEQLRKILDTDKPYNNDKGV